MRILFMITGMALVAGLANTAHADMKADCEQNESQELRISGCTAAISSGEWHGQNLAWAHINRGRAHRMQGDHSLAIEDFDQALSLDPASFTAYMNRGIARSGMALYSRAIEDYNESLRLDPKSVAALSNRGNAYSSISQHLRAIEDFDQALEFNPDHMFTYNNRGSAYTHLGEHRRAIEDYNEALRRDPNYASARNNRGNDLNRLAWALYLEGRNAEALADVDQALLDRPGYAAAFDTRAHVLAALGRSNEALTDFERAIETGEAKFVRLYQEALVAHGFYRGTINGIYDAEVRAALVACLKIACRVLR